MFNNTSARHFIFLLFLVSTLYSQAQPVLPDVAGATDRGLNIISWTCQYDGIKSIAVQRSGDSIYNYTTIGFVKNLKKGMQGYVDGHPNPGKNFYRLYIVFNSELTWYSNRIKIKVDSADLMNKRVLPPNDSLQKLVATMKFENAIETTVKPGTGKMETIGNLNTHPGIDTRNNDTTIISPALNTVAVSIPKTTPKITLDIPEPTEEDGFSYIQSQYIFTNPFTGHVNIEIPDCKKHFYNIVFLNNNDKKVLEIYKVMESKIILDKRNFRKKGIYKFELRRNMKMFETGHITIF